jgi:hypothetical protein
MELLSVRFETNCKDAAVLGPSAERVKSSRAVRKAEVVKGAVGFDLVAHVAPGVSEARAAAEVRPQLPPGALVSRTFPRYGDPSDRAKDEGPGASED